jgi:FAD dependent oxidoreductase TIGR03364
MASFDLVVIGAGIVGLAHALAAVRRGMRVLVLERDSRAASASVRNFGFITVTGQEAGDTRRRALRSRDIWEEVAPEAGIDIVQRGALVVARREEALAVLREYAAGEAAAGCAMLSAEGARARIPALRADIAGALESEVELRVEPRDALPRLAAWLEARHGVVFAWDTAAVSLDGASVRHAKGSVSAGAIVVAPGTGVSPFAPDFAQRHRVRHCKLQMMRLAAPPGLALPAVVMTDLSLLRYGGFAAQPSAARLKARLESECAEELANGVHLIVAQAADGSLVVGDSHHYDDHAEPFASQAVDALIVAELHRLFDLPALAATQRWLGYYPVADVRPLIREPLGPRARLVTVTSGTGMSTAFAIAEETLDELPG